MPTLDQLKNMFSKENSNTSSRESFSGLGYYPFWQMEVDQRAEVRFLPDANENNPTGFFVEKMQHNLEINGQKRKVPCLKMYDEDCPICAASQAYYKAGDQANGKKYWRSTQRVAQVLVVKDPLPADDEGETHVGKVRLLTIGFQLFEVLKEAISSGDLEELPYDFEEGTNFIIKKTKSGKYDAYNIGSKFANRSTALDEEVVEEIEEQLVDLKTVLPKKPDVEEIEAMLEASLTGTPYEPAGSSDDDEDEAPVVTKKRRPVVVDEDEEEEDEDEAPAPKRTKAKAKPVVEDDDDDDEEVDAILAEIRSRNKKKSAA